MFVSAKQENLETIHQHNVIAERFGTLGEIRRELETGEYSEHTEPPRLVGRNRLIWSSWARWPPTPLQRPPGCRIR